MHGNMNVKKNIEILEIILIQIYIYLSPTKCQDPHPTLTKTW